jgi:hypothetical protein
MRARNATGKLLLRNQTRVWVGRSLVLLATVATCHSTFTFHPLIDVAIAQAIEGKPPMQKILASDIGKCVQIVGRLGRPLGELITIQGKWVLPEELRKQPGPDFLVTQVNGVKLETPVMFTERSFSRAREAIEELPTREEEVWEVRGCESGGFRGAPREVLTDASKHAKERFPFAVSPTYKFGFYTEFIYSSFKLLKVN